MKNQLFIENRAKFAFFNPIFAAYAYLVIKRPNIHSIFSFQHQTDDVAHPFPFIPEQLGQVMNLSN